MTHKLKISEKYADDVFFGRKTFEVRKDDRFYKSLDYIRFTVIDDDGNRVDHPLNDCEYVITYILRDFPDALKDGYVVLAIVKE